MKTSENLNELIPDLIRFQADMPSLTKDSTVSMELKSGRTVKYDYVELGDIVEKARQHLAKNNLSIIQPLSTVDGKTALFTMMLHKSGQYIQGHVILELSGKTEQEKGSVITYNSRYDYVGMCRFGLKGEDDDGAAATKSTYTPKPKEESAPVSIGDYTLKSAGQLKGKKLSEISLNVIQGNITYWQNRAKTESKELTGIVKTDIDTCIAYLKAQEAQ